jgi:hypothetical protein
MSRSPFQLHHLRVVAVVGTWGINEIANGRGTGNNLLLLSRGSNSEKSAQLLDDRTLAAFEKCNWRRRPPLDVFGFYQKVRQEVLKSNKFFSLATFGTADPSRAIKV